MIRQLALLLALAVVLPAAARAQAAAPAIVPDVVYGHKDGMALTFDVFRPAEPNGAGIVFMVSGGWVSQWAPPERFRLRYQPLLDRGFTVFSVRHGSAPRYKVPDAAADAERAVRYIRANAGRFGVAPDRLGAWGGSAGGHLSLMVGLDPDAGVVDGNDPIAATPSGVAAVVAYFPPVDLRGWTGPSEDFPALEFADSLAASVSPILFVSSDDPPTLLIHGDADELVPLSHSERIHAALRDAGVATDLIVIEGAGHGFQQPAHRQRALEAVIVWFEKHLVQDQARRDPDSVR